MYANYEPLMQADVESWTAEEIARDDFYAAAGVPDRRRACACRR